jgi:predicted DNA-binding transcriptional regulator YafY
VLEDATGAAVVARPRSPRGPARPAPRGARDLEPPSLSGPKLAGIVEQIRLGDRPARAARRSPLSRALTDSDGVPVSSSQAHMQAIAVLQQAMREHALVWVGYVDAQGGPAARLVRPVSISSGYLRAEDDRTETLHTFALHRITSAVIDETKPS